MHVIAIEKLHISKETLRAVPALHVNFPPSPLALAALTFFSKIPAVEWLDPPVSASLWVEYVGPAHLAPSHLEPSSEHVGDVLPWSPLWIPPKVSGTSTLPGMHEHAPRFVCNAQFQWHIRWWHTCHHERAWYHACDCHRKVAASCGLQFDMTLAWPRSMVPGCPDPCAPSAPRLPSGFHTMPGRIQMLLRIACSQCEIQAPPVSTGQCEIHRMLQIFRPWGLVEQLFIKIP